MVQRKETKGECWEAVVTALWEILTLMLQVVQISLGFSLGSHQNPNSCGAYTTTQLKK